MYRKHARVRGSKAPLTLALVLLALGIAAVGCTAGTQGKVRDPYNAPGASTANRDQRVFVPPELTPHTARDGIRPVYEATAVAGGDAGLDADAPILGVALNGEARAYPVALLKVRGMANDVIGGIPILASW